VGATLYRTGRRGREKAVVLRGGKGKRAQRNEEIRPRRSLGKPLLISKEKKKRGRFVTTLGEGVGTSREERGKKKGMATIFEREKKKKRGQNPPTPLLRKKRKAGVSSKEKESGRVHRKGKLPTTLEGRLAAFYQHGRPKRRTAHFSHTRQLSKKPVSGGENPRGNKKRVVGAHAKRRCWFYPYREATT